jgi:hypothetical protein
MPANKGKSAYYLDWSEFAKVMAEYGRPVELPSGTRRASGA